MDTTGVKERDDLGSSRRSGQDPPRDQTPGNDLGHDSRAVRSHVHAIDEQTLIPRVLSGEIDQEGIVKLRRCLPDWPDE